jgi:hypothetical protein
MFWDAFFLYVLYFEDGTDRLSQNVSNNYKSKQRNISEERISHGNSYFRHSMKG